MGKVKVSIIVPVYNVEEYLEDCLDSLCHQTLQDIEIIIVNDGSTDNSEEIIRNYEQKYHYVTIIEQQNQGLSAARNIGIKYARGKYIMFIDSDDFVDLDLCEQLYNKAEKYNCPLIICGIQLYWNRDREKTYKNFRYDEHKKYDKDFLYKILLTQELGCQVWNKIYRSEELIKSNIIFQPGKFYEDIVFTYKIINLYGQAMFINDLKYKYRMRNNSIVNNTSMTKIIDYINNSSEAINYLLSINTDKTLYKFMINAYVILRTYTSELCILLSKSECLSIQDFIEKKYPYHFTTIEILKAQTLSLKEKIKYVFYTIQIYYKIKK